MHNDGKKQEELERAGVSWTPTASIENGMTNQHFIE